MEREFRVKWEIDIPAESKIEAVKEALRMQKDKESEATVFKAENKAEGDQHVSVIDVVIPSEEKAETVEEYYYQWVIFDPDKSGPEVYALKSPRPITMNDAIQWAENSFPDVNWEKDSITTIEAPSEELI